jgi:hypothetical protein
VNRQGLPRSSSPIIVFRPSTAPTRRSPRPRERRPTCARDRILLGIPRHRAQPQKIALVSLSAATGAKQDRHRTRVREVPRDRDQPRHQPATTAGTSERSAAAGDSEREHADAGQDLKPGLEAEHVSRAPDGDAAAEGPPVAFLQTSLVSTSDDGSGRDSPTRAVRRDAMVSRRCHAQVPRVRAFRSGTRDTQTPCGRTSSAPECRSPHFRVPLKYHAYAKDRRFVEMPPHDLDTDR